MCDPARRCELLEQAELLEAVAPQRQEALRNSRGGELRTLLDDSSLGPLHRVLVEEAARIADRLDRLDLSLSRKGEWLRFERADNGDVVVTIDNVLAEARQQAAVLRGLVAEIKSALPKPEPVKPKREGDGALADFLAHAARRRSPAG